MSEIGTRLFFNYIKEWRVGVNSGTYSSVGESSGIGPVTFDRNPDPGVQLAIPGGTISLVQHIRRGWRGEGELYIHDRNAIEQLLYTIDVTGGTVSAIETGNDRNTIGYFVIVTADSQIVNNTDVRTTPSASYVFENVIIGPVRQTFRVPAEPVYVKWTHDGVTVTTT